MAEITKAPQLRYTQDGQTAISEMWVQFPALRSGDPMSTIKVTGWGNLAQQIQEQFQEGDQVIIEGRLGMNTIDRPEGFKEKQAELTASRIHTTDMSVSASATPAASPAPARPAPAPAAIPAPPQPQAEAEPNYDDIPF
uniref:single-stranded DNA-binding protein n=1 Tax=Acaryochloris sp. IP29b_bin.137 TaxID=2969217 RepID=UPI00260299D1|nr:single-stranded DNA-binding protein [Acaryochloris sp. IP29b_bin.137]